MEIGKQPTEQLLDFCFNTINKALFEMSQNRAESDRKILANILQNDINTKFFRLTKQDVTKAFHLGVREGNQMAINPRTWFEWLNKQKMKSNKLRIYSSQEGERLAIEQKTQEIDRKAVLKEFLELCVIELYEKHCEGEEFVFQGVTQVYEWLEMSGFISLTDKKKEEMWKEVNLEIRARQRFVHNERKQFHPVVMCREKAIRMYFGKWKKQGYDLRSEIFKVIENV